MHGQILQHVDKQKGRNIQKKDAFVKFGQQIKQFYFVVPLHRIANSKLRNRN